MVYLCSRGCHSHFLHDEMGCKSSDGLERRTQLPAVRLRSADGAVRRSLRHDAGFHPEGDSELIPLISGGGFLSMVEVSLL